MSANPAIPKAVAATSASAQAAGQPAGLSTAAAATSPASLPSAPGVKVPTHERIVLPNGMTLIVMPRHDIPLISFNAVLRGGESAAAPGKSGVASLVAGLLEKGAGKRDAFAFVDAVEGVGGTFNAAAGPESIAIRGQFLARDQQLMLELLADALLRPRFKLEELENLRDRQIELIKAAKDSDPSELIGTYGRAFLFQGHQYSRPVIGSESSLASLTHRDIIDYYHTYFRADQLTLVVAGDVDSAWLTKAVARAFCDWSRSNRPAVVLPQPARVTGRSVLLIDSPGSVQTYFWIGNVGVDRHYPHRAALDLVNTLYGGRFTSILNTELRVKSGLSYGARSGFTRGSVAGEFAIRSFAQTQDTGKALDLALQTLAQLKQGAVTAEMLDSARAYLLGQYPLDFETAMDWTVALGEIELYGLGVGDIENYSTQLQSVTLPEMQDVIDTVFPSPDAVDIVLIGDAAQLRDQVGRYGPITEIPLTQPDFDFVHARAAGHHGLR
ncbi:MAG: insulinase family protein [Proteobacteria bacterium]|nr:insulinase family protein [Pseudomonadota bacterium]